VVRETFGIRPLGVGYDSFAGSMIYKVNHTSVEGYDGGQFAAD
jgi:hypothetical protein